MLAVEGAGEAAGAVTAGDGMAAEGADGGTVITSARVRRGRRESEGGRRGYREGG